MSVQAPTIAEKGRRSITAKQRRGFLEALSAGYSVRHSAEYAGFRRERAYDLREKDEEFAREWEEALELGTQVLEDVARKVAVDGIREDVFDAEGKLMRSTRRPYPAMVMFLLKSRRPETYRDNARVEVTGANGGAIELDAGYRPTTLADVLALARDLGLAAADDELDGEAVEDAELLELGEGDAA